ncbi:pimeloyl-ACP methyl ester carboxylesterase [Conyzicola nivalis]|uniref:Pimeloyl-ACP methyl ester carboxylesterase n=1 Tax=Conyzicola nivalis TaxID=1477021 RepID=A0ABV2QKZ3_9MICO
MTEFVTSADGTVIAFDRTGEGPPIILVGGATQFRAFDATTIELAHQLAARGFTAVNYDRRGRGESTDTPPFAIEREIEDIDALVTEVGGSAALYGSSSGAALCLWAAATGVAVTKLVLWEPPLSLPGEGDDGAWLAGLAQRVAAGDHESAAEFFMRDMPPEWLETARHSDAWQTMLEIAPTLVYDAAVLERAQHGPWNELWATVTMPTLVIVGEQTLPDFPPVAEALVAALPNAAQRRIDAANHDWEPGVMADAIAAFLRGGFPRPDGPKRVG